MLNRLRSLLNARLRFVALPFAVLGLLVMTADVPKGLKEAAWKEGDWTGAYAIARPSLPGQGAWLESSEPIPVDARMRIFQVQDPEAFLKGALAKGPEDAALEGGRVGRDPLDVLREAVLWGSRRTFVTAHRVATRALRDTARESDRLQNPRTPSGPLREGAAVSLEGRAGFTLVSEQVPEVVEPTRRDKATGGFAGAEAEELPGRVKLPAQKAGLYIVELRKEDKAAFVPWLVTDLALLGEHDATTLRLQAVKAADGAPVGAVKGLAFEGGRTEPVAFDGDGKATVKATPGMPKTVMVQGGGAFALLRSEGLGRAAVRQRLYAFTERPLYRPGQEVFVKAILRSVREGENEVPSGVKALPFQVLDPEDTEVAKGTANLLNADTATYGASIQLPGTGRLGLHRVVFDGPEGQAQAEFKVEFFQKPTFAVTVKADVPKVGVNDPLKFSVNARYFYGAAVSNAKGLWWLYQVRPSLNWWNEDAGPAPELMESGELQLDAEGNAVLPEFPAKAEGVWRMVVEITDTAGMRYASAGQVRCATGDYVLMLSPDRELVAPGKPFKATVRVLDLDGKEVKGLPVTLKTAAIRFTQRGKEQKEEESRWNWSFQHRPGEVFQQANGPEATLSFPKAGLHLLVAETRDRAGRVIEAIRPMTVAEEGTPLPATPDLKAMADRKEYRVGETARILVRLPRPRLTLHWSIEGETLGQRFTRVVPGTSTLIDVPVTRELQPNAWAVFSIVSDGARQSVEVPLRAPRHDKKLQVKVVPDKARYQPGETMKVDVEVRDSEGKPTRADLSLGVVDEAIYALSAELHPDLFRFFHPSRRHLVTRASSTDWSFWDVMRRQRPVWSLRQTKRGEFKNDEDRVRSVFKDTAHWVPFLAAGSDGRATTTLTLPDNLTAWRATAMAVTPDTRVGSARESRPSSKPLQVSLTLPRILSTGDTSRAIALVRNLSGQPLSGKVRFEVQGGRLEGNPEAAFGPIPDQGEYKFALPLKADQTGKITVTAKAEGGGLKDGERRSVNVVEPLVPASMSGALQVRDGGASITLPVPPGAKGEASLVLRPVAGLEQLVLPSLPYLIQFPYGCVEQTLSSFMPNVRIAAMVKAGAMPPVDWKKLTDLDKNIREGVFKVYGYQLPNGGWGWWSPKDFGPESNPHTTGYAIQSLGAMKKLGYEVDDKVFRNGRAAALQVFRQVAQAADTPSKDAKQAPDSAGDAAFVLLSLVRSGEPVAGMLDSTATKVLQGKWTGGHVLAMTALAAVEAGHPKASALLDALEQRVTSRSGFSLWEGRKDYWYAYHGGDIVPTTYALQALLQGRPASPHVTLAEAYLASQFQGGGWYSTWATSQVLDVIPHLAMARPVQWEGTNLRAQIAGGPSFDFAKVKVDPYASYRSKAARPGFYAMTSPQTVQVAAQGSGLLVWTYSYQVAGGQAPGEAAASGLRLDLKRSLWALRTPQQTGNAKKGWVRVPWTGQLKAGDEAWMELELKASRTSQYAVLEVPIPAGLEPVVKLEGFVLEGHPFSEEDATDAGWWSKPPRIEVHPDKVVFLFNHLSGWGTTKARVLLRAGLPGSYAFRPAKLSLMSNETQWTTCAGTTVNVQEGGK